MNTRLQEQQPARTRWQPRNANQMDELADGLKALADATRLHIIYLLMTHGEMCVCELMPALNLSQSIVSFHLKTLKYAGFITARKEGKWMFYTLDRVIFQQFFNEFGQLFDLTHLLEKREAVSEDDIPCRHLECR